MQVRTYMVVDRRQELASRVSPARTVLADPDPIVRIGAIDMKTFRPVHARIQVRHLYRCRSHLRASVGQPAFANCGRAVVHVRDSYMPSNGLFHRMATWGKVRRP